MKYIYIVKTGTTFNTTKDKYDDFDKWIVDILKTKKVKTIDIQNNENLPNLYNAKGFIITGSHSMVSEELNWSLKLEKYIQKIALKNIPLLGICYGHQLIAKSLGGLSNFNKKGKEIGSVKIIQTKEAKKDPVFKNIPLLFHAHETHYQSAIKLPPNSTILAKNYHEKHQAVRFKKYIWGVQFHPEFDNDIMKEYIINQKESLKKLGINYQKKLVDVKDCSLSSNIIKNFEKLC